MNDDFDIEIVEENSETEKENTENTEETAADAMQLPVNILMFGEIEHDDVKVYIKQDVYKALEKYALEDVKHERGTILIGEYAEELGKTHVVISDHIEAKYTDASASTLTFTHETWDYVHKEQEKKFADKKIVGWQHTHPGYGIFLSNYDMFIQENFFDLPFQVAYVIDPVQNLRGFFQWKNGRVEKLKGYYIYDEVGKKIKIEAPKPKEKETAHAGMNSRIFLIGLILMGLIVAAGVFGFIKVSGELRAQKAYQAELEKEIEAKIEELEKLEAELSKAESGRTGELSAEVEDLHAELSELSAKLEAQQEIIDRLSAQPEEPEEEYITVVIQSGDTLEKACRSVNIDYWKNRKTILELNGIKDENIVVVGQELKLPKSLQEPK